MNATIKKTALNTAGLCVLTGLMGGIAHAQHAAPRHDIIKISEDQAPRIDGDVSDAIWRTAPVIDSFFQINPVEGGAPSERTEVRMVYSKTHLYIAASMYDGAPEDITAKVMTRDTDVDKDDYIQFFIDSYNTRRDSHFFMVSPTGARRDGLTENNRKFAPEWDTIWGAKTKITDEGWFAEIAIPFRSFSYDENAQSWGFEIKRRIARKNEDITWSQPSQSLAPHDVSEIGRLSGVKGTDVGRGLDVSLYATGQATYDWDSARSETAFDPSVNLSYKITPALTGTMTLNTDFSDTPLDARQVNTNRFSLFFPETREFFLQDQNLFAFGGRPMRSPNGLPFFSRRIGIVGGQSVGIDGGLKLSGSLGPVNIGALSTRTADENGLEGQTLSVMRLSTDVGSGSRMGMIVTDGDPSGRRNNTVFGLDGQFKSKTLVPGKNFAADAYYLTSQSGDDDPSGESYGFEIAYPNDKVNWYLRAKHIDEGYNPAMGFTNRSGIRSYDGQYRLRKRYKGRNVRFDTAGFFGNATTDIGGDGQSSQAGLYGQRVWQNGSYFMTFHWRDSDKLDAVFRLPGGASVPIGEYNWNRHSVVYDTGGSRDWRINAEYEVGDWYDGERIYYNGSAEYRPSKHVNLKTAYRQHDISVSGGDVQIKVFSGDVILNITPDMQISNQIQYDNISEGLGYFSRFRWAVRPQTELLVTYSHGAQADRDILRSEFSGLSVRLGNTYRF
ncbi:MAG: DUF5916 domain-containing protein [Robiginitomaculum sp.]